MPITKGQGQSRDSTEWKERGIASALTINLRIFKSKFGSDSRAIYQHFDLNAGSGINEEIGCIGSPLAFIQAVDEAVIGRYRAYFCDIDEQAVTKLLLHEQMTRKECFVFHGDNKSLIRAIPSLINQTDRYQYAIGSVLVDPNGTDIPINDLAWLSRQCPKLDFVINWNSTAFKKNQGRCGSLKDLMDAVDKKYWLIRKPVSAWQWTVLIGRNLKTDSHPTMGFHLLTSSFGKHLFRMCNYTKSEIESHLQQGDLFEI